MCLRANDPKYVVKISKSENNEQRIQAYILKRAVKVRAHAREYWRMFRSSFDPSTTTKENFNRLVTKFREIFQNLNLTPAISTLLYFTLYLLKRLQS